MPDQPVLDFTKTLELVLLPRLDRIEEKMDNRLDAIESKLDQKAAATDLAQLESRVSVNEAWRNRMIGAITAAWAGIIACLGILAKHFGI